MGYKLQRRGDLVAVIDGDTARLLGGHVDRPAALKQVGELYAADHAQDHADCNGIHQIVCIDADCDRKFLGFDSMKDHAEAVHTFSDVEELVRDAVREKYNIDGNSQATPPVPYTYAWCRDFATDWVVFEVSQGGAGRREKSTLYKASYSITDGAVSLGEPVEVVRKTVYEPVKQTTAAASAEEQS